MKPGFLGRLAAKIAGVPIIVHTFHGLSIFDGMPKFRYHLFRLIETIGCLFGDSVMSQGKEDMEVALKKKICPAEKLHYLGNGIELGRFNPNGIQPSKLTELRSELGIAPHQKVIGFIGRSEREKGICEFVEAINLLKRQGVQAKYLIIGAQQPEKCTAVSTSDLFQVCDNKDDLLLLGYRADIPALLALMDILALPSYHEGIPRCLMESAAMGKPVVATQVRGIRETVIDGKTGILVEVRSSSALAKGLLEIIDNPELREELGKNARRHALENFDERLFFHRTDIEYRRLIKAKLNIAIDSLIQPL
jgi:glycosyltransferase involved in cell wall biosynthesis